MAQDRSSGDLEIEGRTIAQALLSYRKKNWEEAQGSALGFKCNKIGPLSRGLSEVGGSSRTKTKGIRNREPNMVQAEGIEDRCSREQWTCNNSPEFLWSSHLKNDRMSDTLQCRTGF